MMVFSMPCCVNSPLDGRLRVVGIGLLVELRTHFLLNLLYGLLAEFCPTLFDAFAPPPSRAEAALCVRRRAVGRCAARLRGSAGRLEHGCNGRTCPKTAQ